MDQLKNLMPKGQPQTSLSKYSQNTLINRKEDCFEMSVYSGELSKIEIVKNVVKVQGAFPSLPPEFFDVFADRIKEKGFSDEKLNDSVNHVIDNCIYPSPTIAQFLSYDKRIKLYSYQDMLKMAKTNAKAFEMYKSVRIGEATKPMFALISDIDNYKLTLWKSEK